MQDITGLYCQCDRSKCQVGCNDEYCQECSGHGNCNCDSCSCDPGYKGEFCECKSDNACINPGKLRCDFVK